MSQHPAVQALWIPDKCPTNLSRSSLLLSLRRKKTDRGQRSAFPSKTSRSAHWLFVHRGSALSWLVDDRASLHPRLIWCVPTRLTRLFVTVPPASRVPPSPERHQIGACPEFKPFCQRVGQIYPLERLFRAVPSQNGVYLRHPPPSFFERLGLYASYFRYLLKEGRRTG